MSQNLLEVKNITMQFGGLKAVENFNLSLRPGELVGLIGPNGAGKTTVFNMLTGVYCPTSGDILLGGQSIKGLAPYTISRLGITRTFQNIRLLKPLSTLENVLISYHQHITYNWVQALLRTRKFVDAEKEIRDKALHLLDIFGLKSLAEKPAGSLSYGNQRKLEIVRALATEPKIIMLDEPAAGMNPSEKGQLMELIAQIRKQFSLTVVLIEHDMKLVMGISERILVLDHGSTIESGSPEKIQNSPKVIEAYLGVDEEALA